jgi:hypothetical protein
MFDPLPAQFSAERCKNTRLLRHVSDTRILGLFPAAREGDAVNSLTANRVALLSLIVAEGGTMDSGDERLDRFCDDKGHRSTDTYIAIRPEDEARQER